MKLHRLTAQLTLLLVGCLSTGCATIRSGALDWNNDNMQGEAAPALEGGTWVAASPAWNVQEPETDWRMLVIFRPT